VLALELLYYAEDIRSSAEIVEAVEETEVKKSELEMARQLVESLAGDFDPSEYRNDYRDELRAMLDAKVSGQEIVRPEPVAEAPVIDLMDALKQSIAAAQSAEATEDGAPAPARARRRRAASR
jgi:DNA end-binding protein Ku